MSALVLSERQRAACLGRNVHYALQWSEGVQHPQRASALFAQASLPVAAMDALFAAPPDAIGSVTDVWESESRVDV